MQDPQYHLLPNPQQMMVTSLPSSLDFYHLGSVEVDERQPSTDPDRIRMDLLRRAADFNAYGFAFHGDFRGALIILFSKDLDRDTYAELGNILASRLATSLTEQEGLGVSISPPYLLGASGKWIQSTLQPGAHCAHRRYFHHTGKKLIPIEVLILGSMHDWMEEDPLTHV